MKIPGNISKDNVLEAINKIDKEGIPHNGQSSTYDLIFQGNRYPPKVVLSFANLFANGELLDRNKFSGGLKSECFKLLEKLGFKIELKLDPIIDVINTFIKDVKKETLKTKHYPKEYRGNKLKVSFGQGGLSKRPWVAIYKAPNTVSHGIYPVFLYFKEFSELLLTYGVSEQNKPDYNWEEINTESVFGYLERKHGVKPSKKYGDSYIHTRFDPTLPIDEKKLVTSVEDILDKYEKLTSKLNDNLLEVKTKDKDSIPLNQILYGPPGTGKTFHTIEAAVIAAEPEFEFSSDSDGRKSLKAKYDELVEEGRIRFVTFHQSYGYEEFVEGLRASTENGNISYEVESGVFKQIQQKAMANLVEAESKVGTLSFDSCWELFLDSFEDEVIIPTIKASFTIKAINEKTIYFDKQQGESQHTLSISTLRMVFNGDKKLKGGLNVYYQPLVNYLKSEFGEVKDFVPKQNYVLVIDEINRGNISKIFGELITLIEDSKRSGAANSESLKLTLPYSGDSFSVPNNLYIIGTMNTADRSLAMMDTALRRRFDFKEMMPNSNHFTNTAVKGINLGQLLTMLNKRIEALYDREHALGHAFFFPVKDTLEQNGEQAAFNRLKIVFQNKILPLLEEYFFEDWHKIRLVLGDNQKPITEQFVIETNVSFTGLFGSNNGLDQFETENKQYQVADFINSDSVWNNPQAYIGIYENQPSTNLSE